MDKKQELIDMINKIESEKGIEYLYEFVKAFIVRFL